MLNLRHMLSAGIACTCMPMRIAACSVHEASSLSEPVALSMRLPTLNKRCNAQHAVYSTYAGVPKLLDMASCDEHVLRPFSQISCLALSNRVLEHFRRARKTPRAG